ncbi:MAG: flagellar hook-length control protein FliK [Candidatus Gastranaerophilales bacterium]|nr:flagellar hook-length control protein FliK [Candidatus Gastranaerophilales bacterium]
MADAIVQNIELLDTTTNVVPFSNIAKTDNDGKFSTLMTNAVNKVEETQSNFIDKAVKSNTSSINQYAINNSQTTQAQTQNKTQTQNQNQSQSNKAKAQTQAQNNQTIQTTQNNSKNVQNNQTTKTAKNSSTDTNTKTTNINNSQTTQKKDTTFSQTPINANQTQTKTSEKSDTSPQNINKDTLESSPFSLEGAQTTELKAQVTVDTENVSDDIQNEIKTIVENILVTFDIPITSDNEEYIDIESAFSDIDTDNSKNLDYIIKSVDEISSQIDNMDLSQDDKDSIMQALNKIKSLVQDNKDSIELNDIVKDTKNVFNEIISKININKEDKTGETELKPEVSDAKKPDDTIKIDTKDLKNSLDELKELINKNSQDSKSSESTEDIKKVLYKLEETLKKEDSETIEQQDNQLIEAVKVLKDDIKKEDIKAIETDIKKISDLIENRDNAKELKSSDNKIELSNNEILKTSTQETNNNEPKINKESTTAKKEITKQDNLETETKNEDTNNLDKFKIEDDDSVSEIVSKLKEFEKTQEYQSLDKEDKTKIDDLINKISASKNNTQTQEKTPKEFVREIEKEVEKIIPFDNIKKEDIKIANTTQETSTEEDSTIQVQSTDVADLNNQNNSNSKNNQSEDTLRNAERNKDIKPERTIKAVGKETKPETDIKIDYSKDTKDEDIELNTDIDNSDVDIESSENTPQKQGLNINIATIQEDILEDISYANETPIALTVADEVAKIALNQNSTLSSQTPIGQVTYDPANSAITIKNVQNIAQNPTKETPETNILNQIGDKLYQLKDSQKLTLVLRPNDLGRLSIELTTDKNGLTTQIIAQNEHVRNYIEKNIHTLRSQLTEAGVNVNSIQIKTAGQDNSSTYEGNHNKEFQQEAQQQKNQNQQRQQRQKDNLAQMRNYDMNFAKDFTSVLNKTLSYIN